MHTPREYTIVTYRPEPMAIHSHIVRWHENGFVIEKRCYCEDAAKFEQRFMRRMGKLDAKVVKVK